MKTLALLAIFSLSSISAAVIEGDYVVKGYDPYVQVNYTGEATIRKDKNNVYQMDMTFEGLKHRATGMMCCDGKIAFISLGPALVRNGQIDLYLTVYKIQENTLDGEWVYYGKDLLGTEILTKN